MMKGELNNEMKERENIEEKEGKRDLGENENGEDSLIARWTGDLKVGGS